MKLKLTQQIIIGQKHENYASLDRLCWLSKNLYNQALYQIRQQYSKDKTYLGYSKLYRLLYDILVDERKLITRRVLVRS